MVSREGFSRPGGQRLWREVDPEASSQRVPRDQPTPDERSAVRPAASSLRERAAAKKGRTASTPCSARGRSAKALEEPPAGHLRQEEEGSGQGDGRSVEIGGLPKHQGGGGSRPYGEGQGSSLLHHGHGSNRTGCSPSVFPEVVH